MSLNDIIRNDELLSKWLSYGYCRLTGKQSNNIDAIISDLRSHGCSDSAIFKLANHNHSLADKFAYQLFA